MKRIVDITGISDSGSAYEISKLIKEGGQCLIIVPGRNRGEILARDLSFFCGREVSILPQEEQTFVNFDARNREEHLERAAILKKLRMDHNAVVIAPVTSVIRRLSPHRDYDSSVLNLVLGNSYSLDQLKEQLVQMGYERTDMVSIPGRFAVRGGILDVYSADSPDPFRIEFFGDEIDSIRTFDAESQRSTESLKEISIYPISPLLDDHNYSFEKSEHLWDYMQDGISIIEDPGRVKERLDFASKESQRNLEVLLERGEANSIDDSLIWGEEDLMDLFQKKDAYLLQPFARSLPWELNLSEIRNVNYRQMPSLNGHTELLPEEVKRYLGKNYKVVITASSKERAAALETLMADSNLSGVVAIQEGYLSSGIEAPEDEICYISDSDIFTTVKSSRRKKKRTKGEALRSFADLSKGDYVVHENHGIGIFLGIEELKVEDSRRDYIKISYAGNDTLYIPVEQMDMVQKYIGSEGTAPRISRLSSDEWKNTKARAKAAIAEMTEELIELYAKRKMEPGYAFSEDTVWQREFEEDFPYEETEDQLKAAEEIKQDMEEPVPMDRLLCGDVGYGKTEVAARAIFKCLSEGKQAAVLVPTTILASQHFDTLTSRFSGYPFNIEMLSRFRTEKEQSKIAEEIKKGRVDLTIGTHRLLSSDIEFKDLGLLVVDEEQRFGVAHKERIKKLKMGVDVLTLSATPIPRTLNMSLTGIKDMSLIMEPPEERYPVQTYVTEEDDLLIREVIERELDREGQVFIVYNRVRGIGRIAEKISRLVPHAKIGVGHGQMNEANLEEVMRKFVAKELNVLIATTIIESGLDIPNANTLIVLEADKCGLAQLYQLRGRVGRSNRIAYAYLMYQKEKVLTEIAEKRLRAIKEFTEFGAGFKIAMRDMELRGAGNLLGSEQSGHMANIGYELYCRLVDDAVRRAKGETVPEEAEEISVEINANATIPSWYIDNETIKLSTYKKIATIVNRADMEDMIDELIDRFGDLPKETLDLIQISLIRALASKLGLSRIHEQSGSVVLEFSDKDVLSPYAIMMAGEEFGSRAFFHAGHAPFIRLGVNKEEKLDDTVKLLEILVENKDKKPVS